MMSHDRNDLPQPVIDNMKDWFEKVKPNNETTFVLSNEDLKKLELQSVHSMTEAMELWKRLFDWTGNPFVVGNHTWQRVCYFCGENKPKHELHCIWLKAKGLIEADEKGLVK